MDDRFWWFSTKLQQVFQKNTPDKLKILLSAETTLTAVDKFCSSEGELLLLFYLPSNSCDDTNIEIFTSSSKNFSAVYNSLSLGLYFAKPTPEGEVNLSNIDELVFAGQVTNQDQNITYFNNVVRNAFLPTLNKDQNEEFFADIVRHCEVLDEYGRQTQPAVRNLVLPSKIPTFTFKSSKALVENPQVVEEYESVMREWIQSIQLVLADGFESSFQVDAKPLTMLPDWRSKLSQIQNIMEELKSRECKAVIALLVTAKSKFLRQWKFVDAGLTDALNSIRDKIKFLECLHKYFLLINNNNNLHELVNTVLPQLFNCIRTQDVVSKFYARNGFLGIILFKLSNEILELCQRFLERHKNTDFQDTLKTAINHSFSHMEQAKPSKKVQIRETQTYLDALLNCVAVCEAYTNQYSLIHEAFGGSQNLKFTPVVYSTHLMANRQDDMSSVMSAKIVDSACSVLPSKQTSISTTSPLENKVTLYGIPFSDQVSIIGHVTNFIEVTNKQVQILETLQRYTTLSRDTHLLPSLSNGDWNVSEELALKIVDSSEEVSACHSQLNLSSVIAETPGPFKNSLEKKYNLFDVNNEDTAEFDQFYENYKSVAGRLDEIVCTYLQTVQTVNKTADQILDSLKCFQSVEDRNGLAPSFEYYYTQALAMFAQEMAGYEERYKKNKDNPPSQRDMPPTSSAVFWVRDMFRRIEATMHKFNTVKIAPFLRGYVSVVKQYNYLATLLLHYEECWLKAWRNTCEGFQHMIKNAVLATDPNTSRLVVAIDQKLLEIISDSKFLKKMKVSIPNSAINICQYEIKIKRTMHILRTLVEQYYSLVDNTPTHLRAGLAHAQRLVLDALAPGLSLVFWNSINSEVFLHQSQVSINNLKKQKDLVCNIDSNITKNILSRINEYQWFQKEDIDGKMWTVETFKSSINTSLGKAKTELQKYFTEIKTNIESIISSQNLSKKQTNFTELYEHYFVLLRQALKSSVNSSLKSLFQQLSHSSTLSIDIIFELPDKRIQPSFKDVQETVIGVFKLLPDVLKEAVQNCLLCVTVSKTEFIEQITSDACFLENKSQLLNLCTESEQNVTEFLNSLQRFDFLWHDTMSEPVVDALENIVEIEKEVNKLPSEVTFGLCTLQCTLVKHSFAGLCDAWKCLGVGNLHREHKERLETITKNREKFRESLSEDINTLEDINKVSKDLVQIFDLDSNINKRYLAIENTYKLLNSTYKIPLPKEEVESVNNLRSSWDSLVQLAKNVEKSVLVDKRLLYEQELDRKLQHFVVEVIQQRNKFDAYGAGLSRVEPSQAIVLLDQFRCEFHQLEAFRNTLHHVQFLFEQEITQFDELTRTCQELKLLGLLYDLYQEFKLWNQKFLSTLWAEANLQQKHYEVECFEKKCKGLPEEVKQWNVFINLQNQILNYLSLFPLLHQLASKEVRSRHWLEIMSACQKTFQLETNVFTLDVVMQINLIAHKEEIASILQNSKAELELELQLKAIEDEWKDHVLTFRAFKGRGPVVFDRARLHTLLASLEECKGILHSMLTSVHVKPFQAHTAQWADKLTQIAHCLQLWIQVEDIWLNLENLFSKESNLQAVQSQYDMFLEADLTYMKVVKRNSEVSNVLECCLGEENSKLPMLKTCYSNFYRCFVNLKHIFEKKRTIFARFNFMPDLQLLGVLGKPTDSLFLNTYISEVISGVRQLVVIEEKQVESSSPQSSRGKRSSSVVAAPAIPLGAWDRVKNNGTASLNDRRQTAWTLTNVQPDQRTVNSFIKAVRDSANELFSLKQNVFLQEDIESTLSALCEEVSTSLKSKVKECCDALHNGCSIEDAIAQFPCQVSLLGMLFQWTRDCERIINEARSDRKAFPTYSKRLSGIVSKVAAAAIKKAAKSDTRRPWLNSMVAVSIHLRDLYEKVISSKVRETTDFEWKQMVRVYNDNDDVITVHVAQNAYEYGYEFLGSESVLILNPAAERCMVNLTLAISSGKIGCLSGENDANKVETVKSLATLLGQHLVVVKCISASCVEPLQRVLNGVLQDNSLCCLEGINNLNEQCLQLLHTFAKNVAEKVQMPTTSTSLPTRGSFAVFVTFPCNFLQHCTPSFRYTMRIVAYKPPSLYAMCKMHLIANGFKWSRALANSVTTLIEISNNQIPLECDIALIQRVIQYAASKRQTMESSNFLEPTVPLSSGGSPRQLYGGGSRSHLTSGKHSVPTTLYPVKRELRLFCMGLLDIVGAKLNNKDLETFKGLLHSVYGGNSKPVVGQPKDTASLSQQIEAVIQQTMLVSNSSFVNKVMQIYNIAQLKQGVIVCGPSCSGKTTAVQVVVALMQRTNPRTRYAHEHFNVLATSAPQHVFGHTQRQEWTHGIFSYVVEKVSRNFSSNDHKTWVTLDGPLDEIWTTQLHDVIHQTTKTFIRPDLSKTRLQDNMQIVFETDSLKNASPTVLANMGLVYMTGDCVGWRTLSEAWLQSQTHSTLNNIIEQCFNQVLDQVIHFIQTKLSKKYSTTSLFSSCLKILTSLLAEHTRIGGHLHVERLFIFSIIWSFGGILVNTEDKKAFSSLVISLTNSLPDDNTEINVFDYCVDDAGEWDVWNTKMDEEYFSLSHAQSDVLIENKHTICTNYLISLLTPHNLLLVGERCSGKTTLLRKVLAMQDKKTVSKVCNLTYHSNASYLTNSLNNSLHHRQGFFYGASNGRAFRLFVEDLHLPHADMHVQSCDELVRQLADLQLVYNCAQQRFIQDLSITATALFSKLDQTHHRLMGKFCVIQLPEPDIENIYSITSGLIKVYAPVKQEVHETLLKVSVELFQKIKETLGKNSKISFKPPTIGHFKTIFQNLLLDEQQNQKDLLSRWRHEAMRVFDENVTTFHNREWFTQTLNELAKENKTDEMLVTFDLLQTNQKKRLTSTTLQECTVSLQSHLKNYNADRSNKLTCSLKSKNVEAFTKIHHTLMMEENGNGIVVAADEKETECLLELVAHTAQCDLVNFVCNPSTLLSDLRKILTSAVSKNRRYMLRISIGELTPDICIDTLHKVLCGELDHVLSETDVKQLVTPLQTMIKAKYPQFEKEPRQFILHRLRENVRYFFTISSSQHYLSSLEERYPTIVAKSSVLHFPDNEFDFFQQVVYARVENDPVFNDIDSKTMNSVVNALLQIHTTVAKTTNETETPLVTNLQQYIVTAPSLELNSIVFKRFVETFKRVFSKKLHIALAQESKLRNALQVISGAESKIEWMLKERAQLVGDNKRLEGECKHLLEQVYVKSTLIEKIKAKYGQEGSELFSQFLSTIDDNAEDQTNYDVDDQILFVDGHDEMDPEYEKFKPDSPQQITTVEEQIQQCQRNITQLKRSMDNSKHMLCEFTAKIDRGCIERLRTYQSPPTMVSSVMVMMMVLLGRTEFAGLVRERTFAATTSGVTTRNKKQKIKPVLQSPAAAPTNSIPTADRSTWKSIQVIMQDSQKFCDQMNNLEWIENVSDDIIGTVISFFAPGEETPPGATGDVDDLLSPNYNREQKSNGISLQAARFSSEDAAEMVHYAQLVIEYTRKSKPYKEALQALETFQAEQLHQLKLEKEREQRKLSLINDDVEVELNPLAHLTLDDLDSLNNKVEELQSQYGEKALRKRSMERQLKEFNDLLSVTQVLVNNFATLKEEWSNRCETLLNKEKLLRDSVQHAATLNYSALFSINKRTETEEMIVRECECIYSSDVEQITEPAGDVSIILDDVFSCKHIPACALISDPHALVTYQVKRSYPYVQILPYKKLFDEVDKHMEKGSTLLVTDVDTKDIVRNKNLDAILDVLNKTEPVYRGRNCSKDFKLAMCTSEFLDDFEASLLWKFHCIQQPVDRETLCRMFLEVFVRHKKQALNQQLLQVNQEVEEHLSACENYRSELLRLCSNDRCFESKSTIKRISKVQKLDAESEKNHVISMLQLDELRKSCETYRPIALQAAVVFEVSTLFARHNPLYRVSFTQFVHLFSAAVLQTEKLLVDSISNKVLQSLFFSQQRAKLEVDHTTFALITAIEMEDSKGRVARGEREFLVSPKTKVIENNASEMTNKTSNYKRPYDWLNDDQYFNIMALSHNFQWFHETWERHLKEGKEILWRQLSEHDTPELYVLPDNEKYTPLQRLLVLRAVRQNRFNQCVHQFINTTLGKSYTSHTTFELKDVLKYSVASLPILLLNDRDAQSTVNLLRAFAVNSKAELIILETQTSESITNILNQHLNQKTWLLLKDVDQYAEMLVDVFRTFEAPSHVTELRVWCQGSLSHTYPPGLLQYVQTFIIDSSRLSIQQNMVWSLGTISDVTWRQLAVADWTPVVWNICLMHAILQCRYSQTGYAFPFSSQQLQSCLDMLVTELKGNRPLSPHGINFRAHMWNMLKTKINKLIYGARVFEDWDIQYLHALVDFWLNVNATRKDYEVLRGRYRIPSILFNHSTNKLLQTVQQASTSSLDSNEFRSLFSVQKNFSVEYCLHTLKHLFVNLADNNTNIQRDSILKQSLDVDAQMAVENYARANTPRYDVIASTYDTIDVEMVAELKTTLGGLVTRLPKLWSKEVVSERIRKCGGSVGYSSWLTAEVEAFTAFHVHVRTSVQNIISYVEGDSPLPDDCVLEDIACIHQRTVPVSWAKMAGECAPPRSWSLTNWIGDYATRFSHLDKLLLQGREKLSGVWLGAFYYPRRFLSAFYQESVQQYQKSREESFDRVFTAKAELTNKEKEHIRDAPSEGVYIYGVHLWGVGWDRATNEFLDAQPKLQPYAIPVVHVTFTPVEISVPRYTCKVKRHAVAGEENGTPVFNLSLGGNRDVNNNKWLLRGMQFTLRNF